MYSHLNLTPSHNFDSIHTPTPSPSAIFSHRVASSCSLASHFRVQSATPSTSCFTSSRVCPACKHILTRDVPTGTVGHVIALVNSGCGREERCAARECGWGVRSGMIGVGGGKDVFDEPSGLAKWSGRQSSSCGTDSS